MIRWIAVVAAACGSGRAKAIEDGARPPPPRTEPHAGDAPPGTVPGVATGDVQLRVEWHDVPTALRASPGRTPCGTARPAAVAPSTTWGIPDAFVVLAAERGKPGELAARVTLEHCALAPRAVVAGAALAVRSAADAPAQLALARRGSLRELGTLEPGTPRAILLPIAGHEVDVPLDAGGVYELALDPETSAWIVAADNSYVAVTDAAGHAVLRDVPAGRYAVTAWLPPRGGQPGRVTHGEANIAAGALAEVTLDLMK